MTDDWDQIQNDLRAHVYGYWPRVRHMLCEQESAAHPGHGISSSDVNHIAYGAVKCGDLVKVEEIELRSIRSFERALETHGEEAMREFLGV